MALSVRVSKRFAVAIVVAAASALGGCQTTFDLVGVAQPLSAGAAHRFDGSYQGDITRVAGASPGCPVGEGERVIMVGDGVLWYAYTPDILFTLPVKYDGAIDGRSGETAMQGKIDGNHMALSIKSPTCQSDMSMTYIYNHS